jgi:ubiquinone/menaquinone biosynthesis C-methylase UbiE
MPGNTIERTLDIALAAVPAPRRVLDVGCGPGTLLRLLATRVPEAEALVGIEAEADVVKAASAVPGLDPRIRYGNAFAEHLPFADGGFDLVVSTTSFDHWHDQRQGLAECARMLRPGGTLVLSDLFSPLLGPSAWLRCRARTRRSADRLLAAVGFREPTWHSSLLTATVVART